MNERRSFTDSAVAFLKGINRFTRAVESLVIDVIAGLAPWLAPLVPAFMVYQGMVNMLKFPAWAAVATAIVVETLGLAGVTTTFQFWDYNDARNKTEQRAPWLIALFTAVFYLAVVLIVNVIMDTTATGEEKLAKGLLSSLSICAGVILALRSQHARRIEANVEAREERRELRKMRLEEQKNEAEAQDTVQDVQVAPEEPQVTDWRQLAPEDRAALVGLAPIEIMEQYPAISERTAQLWAQRVRGIGRNGNGHAPPSR
jgi:hypothetical protein